MDKYDIFVSYRRDGGDATAILISERLSKRGYKVFFDLESMRSGDFNEQIYDTIDTCSDVIVAKVVPFLEVVNGATIFIGNFAKAFAFAHSVVLDDKFVYIFAFAIVKFFAGLNFSATAIFFGIKLENAVFAHNIA